MLGRDPAPLQSGERRLVRHFQFVSWPESGVPATGMPIVEFLREVQKLCATLPAKEPIVVHCRWAPPPPLPLPSPPSCHASTH